MICYIAFVIVAVLLLVMFGKSRRLFVDPKDLSKEIILVTGAANGVGRLLCIELSKYCGNIIGWDIDEAGLEETAQLVSMQTGVKLECQRCDVSCPEEIASCAADLRRKIGRVSVLVNNAGVVNGKFLLEMKREEFERALKVNMFASFYTVQEFLPDMIGHAYDAILRKIPTYFRQKDAQLYHQDTSYLTQQPRGHIVFISSIAGMVPGSGLSDYCSSKAALSMLSGCLEMELTRLKLNRRIVISDIRPYAINTEMFSGCKFNFNFLLPILNGEKVARRIVDAIRFNDSVVYIPGCIALVPIMAHRLYSKHRWNLLCLLIISISIRRILTKKWIFSLSLEAVQIFVDTL